MNHQSAPIIGLSLRRTTWTGYDHYLNVDQYEKWIYTFECPII